MSNVGYNYVLRRPTTFFSLSVDMMQSAIK